MLLSGVFWRSNRNHYYLLLVLVSMRPLAMSIHVRTYLPKLYNEMHYYYDIIPTAVPWRFFYDKYYLFWDNMMSNGKGHLAKFCVIKLSIYMYIKIRRISGKYRSKYNCLRAAR